MEVLIILATIMAIFGVIGYTHGTRFSLFYAALALLGIIMLERIGDTLIRMIDLFYRVGRAMLGGGFKAMSGGEGGFGKLGELVEKIPSLLGQDDKPLALALLLLLIMLVGFALGKLKVFKNKTSVLGLAVGLLTGYVVSAYLLQPLLPETGIRLPLLAGLFGGARQAASAAIPTGSSIGGTLIAKIIAALNALASSGQIAILIAIAIVVFILLATRLGNRGVKKG